MRILAAPDSFKGSMSAQDACAAMVDGARRADSEVEVITAPMADGGEGTVHCLIEAWGGTMHQLTVPGPLGEPVSASYGHRRRSRTAVVDLAAASGLAVTTTRSPLAASTRGTGDLIAAAVADGAEEVVLGLGGSATTDGGTGLLRALGFRFLDAAGRELREGGGSLSELAHIDMSDVSDDICSLKVRLACDVRSPLVGSEGAAATFAPQKGARPNDIELLERGLQQLADVILHTTGISVAHLPGGGAAGGTAAGLVGCLGATIDWGAELVADAIGLEALIPGIDLILTGEGRLDGQTAHGKVVSVVANRGQALGTPVVAICGLIDPSARISGLDAAFSLGEETDNLDCLIRDAASLLATRTEEVVRMRAALVARKGTHRFAPKPSTEDALLEPGRQWAV